MRLPQREVRDGGVQLEPFSRLQLLPLSGVQLQTANTFSPKFVSESWKLTVVVSVVNEACAGANLKVWKRWLPQR